ncbi:hypothetical protein QFC21_000244 [Naganishia friedmannii]|uniref:Uncharacterized protein n=1 Tax=Naganishia friedmannii TaxID=89922 RepID=A0ACC2WB00_9TREE|nr:hypothetical protein QFC21_000244 [Naganishia friedmannii]
MPTEHKNRIILGLMTFGPDEDKGARITSMDEYKRCLDLLTSRGYNEIDTARVYVGGKQEAWTRDAGWKERGFKIASKWYPHEAGAHKPEVLKGKVQESLKELGTDSVDIYYLHAADRATPFQETLKAVDDMYKAGKFKTFAISNFTAAEVAEVCLIAKYNGWVRPTLYQGMYNAITRSAEKELFPVLRRFGLDYVAYNPIAGGILSGKYKTSDVPKEGRYSDSVGAMGGMYRKRYFKDSTFEALRVIEPAVEKAGLTMVETALRWMVHHSQLKLANKGGNDGMAFRNQQPVPSSVANSIIIGVSSYDQLEKNLDDLEKGPLPEDVVKALDEAWSVIGGSAPDYWHLPYEYTYDTIKAVYGEDA